jgi:phage/plasmid-like protein (TIGR03299 family)
MVSTREVPWMKLGKIVPTMDSDQAMKLGGLDFTVSLRDSAFSPEGAHDGKSWTEFPARKVVVRDDTNKPFDFVSSDYTMVQYAEALAFMNAVSPTFVAAGCLKGGRQGFLVCSLPGSEELSLLNGEDRHEMYAVLRASHDRTRKIEVAVMPLRHRCMNQLTLRSFTKGAQQRWTIAHRGDVTAKMQEAEMTLTKFAAYCRELESLAERLNSITVEHEQAEMILERVLPNTPKREEKKGQIISLWRNDETIGYPTSGWGLTNAVSSFYDWGRIGGNPESRFTASLNGQTKNAIDRTAGILLSINGRV